MDIIHEKQKNKSRANKIRSALALQGLSVRSWALTHGYVYNTVHQLVAGEKNKLKKVGTKCGQAYAELVAEGFWPLEDTDER